MRRLLPGLLFALAGCEDLPPEAPPPVPPVVIAPTPSAVPVRVMPSVTPTPMPTSTPSPRSAGEVALTGHLDARTPTVAPEIPEGPANFVDVPGAVEDSNGLSHCAVVRFTHTDDRTWSWQVYILDAASITPNLEDPPTPLMFGSGLPESGAFDVSWNHPSGTAATASLRLDLRELTERPEPSAVHWPSSSVSNHCK